jgi:CrcB protein
VGRILAIGCGGFLGAVLRYWISGWVYTLGHGGFPVGTLVVNVLGAFTTFSTFSFETMALLEVGSHMKALLNVGASLLLGLVAVLAGLVAGRAL